MKKIIECIPNFSEGRDQKKLEQIIAAISAVPGVFMLDHESDAAHNRSVVTIAGSPEAVLEGAFQGIKKASELIDLNKHKGEHPRMGATDVCPLVPLKGVKTSECVKYAEELGERVGKELKIPVYLYEKAARTPERENLADVRKGEYEGIKEEMGKVPSRKPDFGPSKMGKAGCTAIGVREALVAYNVNLNTDNLKVAQKIAKTVRAKNGGFQYVKAMGFMLDDRKPPIAQVSMNLVNYKKSTVHHVFEAIKRETARYGVGILESEIIGLIPQRALFAAAKHYLQIDGFKNKQVLEVILQKHVDKSSTTLDDFLSATASKSPVPGGGSVAALSGALAAALTSMVCALTKTTDLSKTLEKAEALRSELYKAIETDAQAYRDVVAAYRAKNPRNIQTALKQAAQSPLHIAQTASKLLPLIEKVASEGNPNAISDCGVALHTAEAAIKGGILNIRINLKEIADKKFHKEMQTHIEKLQKSFAKKSGEIEEIVNSKL